jgi:predicted porin
MKKTLAAVAILGAFAGSAMADVTVYGRIDRGLLFTDDGDKQTVEMANGLTTGGRWGLKGSTAISETTKAGFVLESRVYGDTGAMPSNNKMFDREATIYVAGPYGTVYAGRINSFWSDGGSVAMFSNYAAFGTGSGVGMGTGMFVGYSRTDNTLAYVSPSMGGVKLYAEYVMGDEKVENKSAGNQHFGLGLEYKAGAFGMALAVMADDEKGQGTEDQQSVNVGATYDFGAAKAFLAGQYFKDANKVGTFANGFDFATGADQLKGYAVNLGAAVPMAGGVWTVGGTYTDFENEATGQEADGYNVTAQYVYSFSKQVQAYAGVGYTELEGEGTEVEKKLAMAGMVVRF